MRKVNKKLLLVTCAITLLPMLVGLALWNRLPEQMPTHWNSAGEIDGWSGRNFAVFGLPCVMCLVHGLCVLMTGADPKNKNQGAKAFGLVYWICPVVSLLTNGMVYAAALGIPFRVERLLLPGLGVMFLVLGNYLPKCKQNYTIGIKLPWTLDSEENWTQTHRLAGRLWVAGGVLMIVFGFFNWFAAYMAVILVVTVVPMVYSYLLYRRSLRENGGG